MGISPAASRPNYIVIVVIQIVIANEIFYLLTVDKNVNVEPEDFNDFVVNPAMMAVTA